MSFADTIWSAIGVIGAIAGIVVLLWASRSGPRERAAEDAAREFYDAHGRWPDEPA